MSGRDGHHIGIIQGIQDTDKIIRIHLMVSYLGKVGKAKNLKYLMFLLPWGILGILPSLPSLTLYISVIFNIIR